MLLTGPPAGDNYLPSRPSCGYELWHKLIQPIASLQLHATATFSFFQAYIRYVSPLENEDLDSPCQEGLRAAELYGALYAPASSYEMHALFDSMQKCLEPSAIVFEFLKVMQLGPILPAIGRPMQRILVRAAVDIVPSHVKRRLGLPDYWRLRPSEYVLV